MIVFVIVTGLALLLAAFVALPPLPATPQVMIDIGDTFIDGVVNFINLMHYIFHPVLFRAFLVVTFLIFFFQPIYSGIMWILRKIPVLGIK